jgi:putative aldouronate transport system permease protein
MVKEKITNKLYILLRISIILGVFLSFIPAINPARISEMINKNLSLFTSGLFYSRLTENFGRAFTKGWIGTMTTQVLFISCMIMLIGFVVSAVGGCMSLGNTKMKKVASIIAAAGAILTLGGVYGVKWAEHDIQGTSNPQKIIPLQPSSIYFFLVVALITLILAIVTFVLLPKVQKGDKFEMESKFKLFLLIMPFIALTFVFAYLPLAGWRYAFFNYKSGEALSKDNFVGFKWFTYLFENPATRADLLRVMKNTLAMSGLGLATSWCSMAFAIFLSEIKNKRIRRFVQTFTTIPNFISWVLVFAVAFSIFSTDGFVSSLLMNAGVMDEGKNFLMSSSHIWIKMLAWGMWKGLGWGAIIYIAAISGIDQQLYEAATVDGAGRFQRMWNITVPSLMPTFMVLLLLAIAGILNNGLEQYLVFENAKNTKDIMVLDLYVYKLGINNGKIPLATVVGMAKSIISVILLFGANKLSKTVRGESII